jgi:hypothetical protein
MRGPLDQTQCGSPLRSRRISDWSRRADTWDRARRRHSSRHTCALHPGEQPAHPLGARIIRRQSWPPPGQASGCLVAKGWTSGQIDPPAASAGRARRVAPCSRARCSPTSASLEGDAVPFHLIITCGTFLGGFIVTATSSICCFPGWLADQAFDSLSLCGAAAQTLITLTHTCRSGHTGWNSVSRRTAIGSDVHVGAVRGLRCTMHEWPRTITNGQTD